MKPACWRGEGKPVLERHEVDLPFTSFVEQLAQLRVAQYSYDAQWSTEALLDDNETEQAQYKYRAFGLLAQQTGAKTTNLNFVGKQGYYKDDEIDLYLLGSANSNNGGRYYDPATGRFLSYDAVDDDLNEYRYVRNNPINAVDPTGQDFVFEDAITKLWYYVFEYRDRADSEEKRAKVHVGKTNKHLDTLVNLDVAGSSGNSLVTKRELIQLAKELSDNRLNHTLVPAPHIQFTAMSWLLGEEEVDNIRIRTAMVRLKAHLETLASEYAEREAKRQKAAQLWELALQDTIKLVAKGDFGCYLPGVVWSKKRTRANCAQFDSYEKNWPKDLPFPGSNTKFINRNIDPTVLRQLYIDDGPNNPGGRLSAFWRMKEDGSFERVSADDFVVPSPTELQRCVALRYAEPIAAETSSFEVALDWVQGVLDVAGLAPGPFGVVADLASAGASTLRGDKLGAALSVTAAIPAVGESAGATKLLRRFAGFIDFIHGETKLSRQLLRRMRHGGDANDIVKAMDRAIESTSGRHTAIVERALAGTTDVADTAGDVTRHATDASITPSRPTAEGPTGGIPDGPGGRPPSDGGGAGGGRTGGGDPPGGSGGGGGDGGQPPGGSGLGDDFPDDPNQFRRASQGNAPGGNHLGTLRNVGQDAWESSGGLRYVGRDPQGLNRVQHVLRHADDIPGRAGRHGVFDAGRNGTMGVVDEAWGIAQRGGPGVTVVQQGNRTLYTVDMGRRVGYVGGQAGAAAGNPAANHVFIVIENGNQVISAFPIIP